MTVATTLGLEPDLDLYADLTKAWCTDLECAADVVDGFCVVCGSPDHDPF